MKHNEAVKHACHVVIREETYQTNAYVHLGDDILHCPMQYLLPMCTVCSCIMACSASCIMQIWKEIETSLDPQSKLVNRWVRSTIPIY